MHSKNLIHLTTWMLVNPTQIPKPLKIHIRGLPTSTEWPSCCSPPSTTPRKSPDFRGFLALSYSWVILLKKTRFLLLFANLNHSHFKMEILPYTHTHTPPCNFCNKSPFHIRIAAVFVGGQFSSFTKNPQQSLHSSNLTDTSLKQVIFLTMFMYHTEFKKSFWTSKTPQKMSLLQ